MKKKIIMKICRDESPGSVIYIPHGGGPWPLLGDSRHFNLIAFLKAIPDFLIQPSAILVVSAHWEEKQPKLLSATFPPLLYDYYGFPQETYSISYNAPGNPQLAERILHLFEENGISAGLDGSRGYDHGFFVPLKLMYPEAAIPCIQLSLLDSLNPAEHIRIGNVLRNLQEENLLIIGSGSSFHNLAAFRNNTVGKENQWNEAFENWLIETLSADYLSEKERRERLEHWFDAPFAAFCHPREEHLLPLHVCYGVSGCPAKRIIEVEFMGKKTSSYIW
ncbi:DODA-type extradiol aromatic ring-opening family dioxygenase [Desulfomarina sp.]